MSHLPAIDLGPFKGELSDSTSSTLIAMRSLIQEDSGAHFLRIKNALLELKKVVRSKSDNHGAICIGTSCNQDQLFWSRKLIRYNLQQAYPKLAAHKLDRRVSFELNLADQCDRFLAELPMLLYFAKRRQHVVSKGFLRVDIRNQLICDAIFNQASWTIDPDGSLFGRAALYIQAYRSGSFSLIRVVLKLLLDSLLILFGSLPPYERFLPITTAKDLPKHSYLRVMFESIERLGYRFQYYPGRDSDTGIFMFLR